MTNASKVDFESQQQALHCCCRAFQTKLVTGLASFPHNFSEVCNSDLGYVPVSFASLGAWGRHLLLERAET